MRAQAITLINPQDHFFRKILSPRLKDIRLHKFPGHGKKDLSIVSDRLLLAAGATALGGLLRALLSGLALGATALGGGLLGGAALRAAALGGGLLGRTTTSLGCHTGNF